MPASAAEAFVTSYRLQPESIFAGEAVFFLGVALGDLGYGKRACIAFHEAERSYADALSEDIQSRLRIALSVYDCG